MFRDLNFDIESGKFICIIGRSGTGKTTLLNLIAGLTPFDSGEITLGDMKYSEKTSDELTGFRGGNISFIFQQFHLIPNLTVEENVELPLRINAIKPRYQIDEILERVGLG
ncbi:MAG: ATP-binding cassette domain-containing protein [Candidatus Peribacteria bacterium]|nr:MAG: ATP-binding cassette domain-containing protein [Candidatus Peribacteria bacterium]